MNFNFYQGTLKLYHIGFGHARAPLQKVKLRRMMWQFPAALCTCKAKADSHNAAIADFYQLSLYVGYAQSGLQNGATMVAPQFLGIGSSTAIDLQSIKPQGDETSDNVSIQTLDAYGRMIDMYIWCNWAGPESDQEAWSDGSGDIIEGVTFAPGTGLWVQGLTDTQAIQTAGAVGKSDVSVALVNGATATGNPFPVSVDLQDIIPQGENTSDNVSIQTLDAYGRMIDMYIWCNWAGPESDQEAWSDGSGDIIEGVTFPAGQGLWVQGSESGQFLRFPAPEL